MTTPDMEEKTGLSLSTYYVQMSNSGYFLIQLYGCQSSLWFVISAALLCTCAASLCKELSRLVLHYHGRLFNEDSQEAERQVDYDRAMFSI